VPDLDFAAVLGGQDRSGHLPLRARKVTHSRLRISRLCTIGEHFNLTMKPVAREHQRPDWERVAVSTGFKDLLAVGFSSFPPFCFFSHIFLVSYC
jgi:hypothetical protein